jgi:hypothetical protein
MPCKNGGGAPEWARRRLWIQRGADPNARVPWHQSPWRDEIVDTCHGLLSGKLGCIEVASKMANLSEIVLDAAHGDRWLHKDWEIFYEALEVGKNGRMPPMIADRLRAAAQRFLQEVNDVRT